MNIRLGARGFGAVQLAAGVLVFGLGGCANELAPQAHFVTPTYLGADAMAATGSSADADAASLIIEPTSSSKVLSAIVFERVTGRTAYPDGFVFGR